MTRTSSLLPAILSILVATAVLAACAEGNVFELSVGDCFDEANDFEGGEISDVPIVDCDEPHDYEVYALASYEGDDYPGDVAMAEFADDACLDAFAAYVGNEFMDSELYFIHFTPSTGSWAQGDREVACMLFEVDESFELTKLEGSMRGSGR